MNLLFSNTVRSCWVAVKLDRHYNGGREHLSTTLAPRGP